MTVKELASQLNGREYMGEIDDIEAKQAADAGLVVVFGYSDDTMELRGAINDVFGCYDGGTVYLTKSGVLREPSFCDPEKCRHYAKVKNAAAAIKAVWHGEGYPWWTYETDIPHETFDIYEDGELSCVGIVFSVDSLAEV